MRRWTPWKNQKLIENTGRSISLTTKRIREKSAQKVPEDMRRPDKADAWCSRLVQRRVLRHQYHKTSDALEAEQSLNEENMLWRHKPQRKI